MSDYHRIKVYFEDCGLTFVATEDVYGVDTAAREARNIARQLPPEARVEVEPIYSNETYWGTSSEQSSGDGGLA